MKFIQTGTFRKNYLEEQTTLNVLEKVEIMFLDQFDYFIGFVVKEKPKISDYFKNLKKKYQNMTEEDYLKESSGEIKKIITKYENLKLYPDLVEASLNYFITLLQLENNSAWEPAEVETSMKALIQAWTYPSYYFLESLAETIGRNEAVKLIKRYITSYYNDHPLPSRDNFVSLKKWYESCISGDTTSSEWVIVHAMLEDGKYAYKNKNCPTCVDAMKDLPDVEFKYLTTCYSDYAKFKARTNDHIILTMEHTIMEGDPYCSRVFHDTRIDYHLKHPPKEFWDNFEPGKEKEAMKYYKKY